LPDLRGCCRTLVTVGCCTVAFCLLDGYVVVTLLLVDLIWLFGYAFVVVAVTRCLCDLIYVVAVDVTTFGFYVCCFITVRVVGLRPRCVVVVRYALLRYVCVALIVRLICYVARLRLRYVTLLRLRCWILYVVVTVVTFVYVCCTLLFVYVVVVTVTLRLRCCPTLRLFRLVGWLRLRCTAAFTRLPVYVARCAFTFGYVWLRCCCPVCLFPGLITLPLRCVCYTLRYVAFVTFTFAFPLLRCVCGCCVLLRLLPRLRLHTFYVGTRCVALRCYHGLRLRFTVDLPVCYLPRCTVAVCCVTTHTRCYGYVAPFVTLRLFIYVYVYGYALRLRLLRTFGWILPRFAVTRCYAVTHTTLVTVGCISVLPALPFVTVVCCTLVGCYVVALFVIYTFVVTLFVAFVG